MLPTLHGRYLSEEVDASTSCASQVCSASIAGRNTMIIFDWDDTLLCSTAVRANGWSAKHLQELEQVVQSILRTAMGLGETLIVTNGNGTWVHDSSARFLPGLLPYLNQLRVVSARALYEAQYPGDPFMWKQAAFEQLLTKERKFAPATSLNLVALGDQFPELDAARHIGQLLGEGACLVKTLKFREAPSISELLGQLSRAEDVLAHIVKERENQDYVLVQPTLPPDSEHLIARACGWSCSLEEESRPAAPPPWVGGFGGPSPLKGLGTMEARGVPHAVVCVPQAVAA